MGDEQSTPDSNAFDYGSLEDKTRRLIESYTAEIKIRVRRSAQDVIDIGRHLSQAKKLLGHGQFLGWIETEFGWSERTARNFMQASQKFKSAKIADLEIAPSALYVLSAPGVDNEVRRKAVELAQQGISVTHATAKQLIQKTESIEEDDGAEEDVASNPTETRSKTHSWDAMRSSLSVEHYTPKRVLDAVLQCFKGEIGLDPCSNRRDAPNVPAARHYFLHDDALTQDWSAESVFMNPPYGREIDRWVSKLVDSYTTGKVEAAIALVPARTDTQWFAQLNHYPVCFVRGRLTFVGNDASAPFPSALFYLGQNLGDFYYAFNELGEIWQRVEPWMFGI